MKNNKSCTAKSKAMDKNVNDSIVTKKMRIDQKHNLKELTIPIKRIDHETETTIKIEAVDDDETGSVEPICGPSNGQEALHQQDENDEELFKLEQMFSLNEFSFSVEVTPKCSKVSAEDGLKRTRSGRLIKTTSKFQSEAGNQTATTAPLNGNSDDEKGNESTGSENSESESELSGIGIEAETESDEPASNPGKKLKPKIGSQPKYLGDRGRHDEDINPDLKCDICDKSFSEKYCLKRHKETVHSNVRLFLCDECPHTSKLAVNLKVHKERVHPVSKDHICFICGKAYAVNSALVAHEKTHRTPNEEDDSPPKCDSCGAVFASAQALKSHKRIHSREIDHSNDNKNESNIRNDGIEFTCSYCSQSFAFLHTMRMHKRRAHFNKFRFKCDQCPYGAPTFPTMEYHKLTTHSTHRPFKCPNCESCFKTPRDLNKHFKRLHPVSKDHICSECGKAFVQKAMLTLHQFSAHKIPKPVGSTTANQRAANSSHPADRAGHDRTFDSNGNDSSKEEDIYEHGNGDVATKAVRCKLCRKELLSKENLERHKLRMHGPRKVVAVEVDEPERVEFQCEECHSIFSAKRNLIIHMKVHDEGYAENHLTCSICDRAFSSKQGLRRHTQNKHKEES